jgi:RecA/RadA recombinase
MSQKPFDVSKFRNSLTKSISGISAGFRDPDTWISTGSYALNYLISGDFNKGVPLGKVTVFSGESGCLPDEATVIVRITEKRNITMIEKEITVKELRELYKSGKYNIDISTPDGFQPISRWFDKGVMEMVNVVTPSHSTRCAVNHMIQFDDDSWALASELDIGATIQTMSGPEPVLSVTSADPAECYDFEVNHPNHRYYGDGIVSHNSGKSFLASGNIVRNAQEQGIFVVIIDSENALDESWLQALGVDTSPDKLLKLSMAMIDDVAKTIHEFMKSYKEIAEEQRPKVLFVIDSLGMLLTPTDVAQFEAGDMKGDMGRKPKALMALVRNTVNMIGAYDVGLVATNHSYASQDPYDPDPKVSGGSGFVFASSILVAMKKLKLKEDEDGNKVSQVLGIRAGCKVMKSRYAKPFEDIELQIPYESGMNEYTGLFTLFEKRGLLTKEGNRYSYTTLDGVVYKLFRKEWNRNQDGVLDKVMIDFTARQSAPAGTSAVENVEEMVGE